MIPLTSKKILLGMDHMLHEIFPSTFNHTTFFLHFILQHTTRQSIAFSKIYVQVNYVSCAITSKSHKNWRSVFTLSSSHVLWIWQTPIIIQAHLTHFAKHCDNGYISQVFHDPLTSNDSSLHKITSNCT